MQRPPVDCANQAGLPRRGKMIGSLLLLLLGAIPAFAQPRSWNTGSGNWATGANWSPVGAPGVAQTANIGNLAGVQNSTVTLNQNATVNALNLSDGMRLLTSGNRLTVTDELLVEGQNVVPNGPGESPSIYSSWIRIDVAAVAALDTPRLTLNDGGSASLYDGAIVDIDDLLLLTDSVEPPHISGRGVIRLNDTGATLVNGGTLRGGTSPGLTLQQMSGGTFDLDGYTASGSIELYGENGARLRLIGTALADSFGGQITMVRGAELQVDLTNGWTSDADSGWGVFGTYPALPPARVSGGDVTFAGVLQVVGNDAHLEFAADTTLTPEARILVSTDDDLTFGVGGASTTVDGGECDIAAGGEVTFTGPTLLRGGQFDRITDLTATVRFEGATTYDGSVSGNASLRQIGTATVSGASSVTADYFDMDGMTGGTTWNINNSMTLNVDSIDSPAALAEFNGSMNITGGLLARLTVNLSDPTESWSLAGTTTLGGDPALFPARIGGSQMQLRGTLNLPSGRAQILAPTTIASTATVSLAAASAQLRLNAPSLIENGATFSGAGTLINGVNGVMTLEDGASTDSVALQNLGALSLSGLNPAIATVHRFENGPAARLRMSIGGNAAGSDHDLLIVSSGPATLAGSLAIEMFNIGNGQFAPAIGDEFTIITAAGGINGAFSSDPVTCAGSEQYHWTVIYEPNEVTVRLTAVSDGLLGDLNCDCVVSVGDIGAFVTALTDAGAYAVAYPECGIANADVNQDGVVSVGDISGFVALLTQ